MMFNFFLITGGFLINAYAFLIRDDSYELAGGVAIVGILISLICVGFDIRNHQLVKLSEWVLKDMEENILFPRASRGDGAKSGKSGILRREEIYGEPNRFIKHKFLIRTLQLLAGTGFAMATGFAFYEASQTTILPYGTIAN